MLIPPTIRYHAASIALKAFSATNATRKTYRYLGNTFGQKRHSVVSNTDVQRGRWLCEQIADSGLSLDENATVLELGTGWTHFYAIFLRLFYASQFTLFDVQDNRQLGALKDRTAALFAILEHTAPGDFDSHLAQKVVQIEGFAELYQLLGMNYVIENSGSLRAMENNAYDVVFSVDVLEHVARASLQLTISEMYRVLKPGGICLHQIGLDDHLSHYAPGMPSKNYLRYSDRAWKMFYENRVQYINRVQLAEFVALFQRSGFELELCQTETDADGLSQIAIHSQYQKYSSHDLEATRALLVCRKGSK